MKLPSVVQIEILPHKVWKMYVPYIKSSEKGFTLNKKLVAGYKNQPISISVFKKTAQNTREAFPIRLVENNNKYKFTPIVGILTVDGPRGFKGNRKNYREIIETGYKKGVLVYVFTAESIDFQENYVNAYLFLPHKRKWIRRDMPLPDVIYNRIPYREDETRSEVKEVLDFIETEKIPFFNPHFFDKWTLNQWLKDAPQLKRFVPETVTINPRNFQRLLNTNRTLYLKPIHGKAGVGFIKIEKRKNLYKLTFQSKHGVGFKTYRDIRSVWLSINNYIKINEYLLQKGIDLSTYNGNPFDVRVLVQKDAQGKWGLSGIGIRVAGSQSITTHVPRGGYIESVDTVFTRTFGPEYLKEWKRTIAVIAIRIAKFIEQKSGYQLGEMSLDLGIDNQGDIWFFEANSKPMEFDEPTIRRTSLLTLIDYFSYLAKQAH